MREPRKILLIEPNYKNKYPPIGLMKISSYHRGLGDEVEFFKGDLKELVLSKLTEKCISALKRLNPRRNWTECKDSIKKYIQTKHSSTLDVIVYKTSPKRQQLIGRLNFYHKIYREKRYDYFPKWDRVYVTSLFTFYWKITVSTITFAKHLVRDIKDVHVGGVLASLLPNEVEAETGIRPHQGLLDHPGMLDPDIPEAQAIVIDDLPLDYSILEEIEYQYPTGSAYFTFMTKGCTRKCAFCSVPILEPTYKPKIDTVDKFFEVKKIYGEQQHLLLMDNNVLASPKLADIIQEIKQMGFHKGATLIEPNQLDISIKNLKNGLNDKAYIKRSQRVLCDLTRRLRGRTRENYVNILEKHQVECIRNTTKRGLLNAYKEVKDIYETYRNKMPVLRFVDFNQGTDARYINEDIMKLLSEIPIRPLRIAFDYWGLKDIYESAVRLAAKYGFSELSNYILYNFNDSPDELYKRLQINILLNEELGTKIFSFPMKYIPLFGEEAKDRNFIGKKWNRKYIRAIQSILNVTRGIVAPGKTLFNRAFGKNLEEFHEILLMPEEYIVYRQFFDDNGLIDKWRADFSKLSVEDTATVIEIICSNKFNVEGTTTLGTPILSFLRHYKVRKEAIAEIRQFDFEFQQAEKTAIKMIKTDNAMNLTLTYDFENSSAPSINGKRQTTKLAVSH